MKIHLLYNESLYPSTNEYCFDLETYLPRCINDIPKDDIYGNVLIGKGRNSDALNGVDFFNNKRNKNNPTIGFAECCKINRCDNENKKSDESGSILIVVLIIFIIILVVITGLVVFIVIKKKYLKNNELKANVLEL